MRGTPAPKKSDAHLRTDTRLGYSSSAPPSTSNPVNFPVFAVRFNPNSTVASDGRTFPHAAATSPAIAEIASRTPSNDTTSSNPTVATPGRSTTSTKNSVSPALTNTGLPTLITPPYADFHEQ